MKHILKREYPIDSVNELLRRTGIKRFFTYWIFHPIRYFKTKALRRSETKLMKSIHAEISAEIDKEIVQSIKDSLEK